MKRYFSARNAILLGDKYFNLFLALRFGARKLFQFDASFIIENKGMNFMC